MRVDIPDVPTLDREAAISYLQCIYPPNAVVDFIDLTKNPPISRRTTLQILATLIRQFPEYDRTDYVGYDAELLHYTAIQCPIVRIELYRQQRRRPDIYAGDNLFSSIPEDEK
jgi:hypothetical protein